ncbi:hypothetical protein CR105_23910 [Massilia eurypsychrophila]|uniref:Uncharacterized protein n=1 Tax=Massilia eurypsychrophila TaxID=1485217 RepID=A0A2G8T905_9BURK|nr:hypothetical protein CR105_23910 [Massilia eurypsychrophila]
MFDRKVDAMQSEEQGMICGKRLKELRNGRHRARKQAAARIKLDSDAQRVGENPARVRGKS